MKCFNSVDAAIGYFASLSPSTIKLGLERISQALAALDNPQNRFPSVHVAGTNGKGSVCAMTSSCLVAAGYKVGLYTSPHLEKINERIALNGVAISDEALANAIDQAIDVLGLEHGLTYFEFGTLLAFQYFAEQKVQIAVIETGLGGRLDASRLVNSIATAITSISLDHMQYLGDTVEKIAYEKAGIIKAQIPLVLAENAPSVVDVIRSVARSMEAPVRCEGRDFSLTDNWSFQGRTMKLDRIVLALKGPHQRHNAAVALALLEILREAGWALSSESMRSGLQSTKWPGRLEMFSGSPRVLLDGAHNEDGVAKLVAALNAEFSHKEKHLVFGVLADKNFANMVAELFPKFASVHWTKLPSDRTAVPAEHLTMARTFNDYVWGYEAPFDALVGARNKARIEDLIVVAGSLVLVGEVRKTLH